MTYYVYILESLIDGTLYKGYTTNYDRRLQQHNLGLSRYTALKRPWKLIYLEICEDKKAAIIREKQLKKYNRTYIDWLCKQPSNICRKTEN